MTRRRRREDNCSRSAKAESATCGLLSCDRTKPARIQLRAARINGQLQNPFCAAVDYGLDDLMSAYEPGPDRVWDEYEWERFLQQQDHKTEKYMELLEKYLDHPQRDQIIAREMGWTQLLNEEESDSWSDEVDAMLAEESNSRDDTSEQQEPPSFTDGFEDHTLYRAA